MIYKRNLWFWAMVGFFAVIFLCLTIWILLEILSPQQLGISPPLWFKFILLAVLIIPYLFFFVTIPRLAKTIEVKENTISLEYINGKHVEIKNSKQLKWVNDFMGGTMWISHSKGVEFITASATFKNSNRMFQDIERVLKKKIERVNV